MLVQKKSMFTCGVNPVINEKTKQNLCLKKYKLPKITKMLMPVQSHALLVNMYSNSTKKIFSHIGCIV